MVRYLFMALTCSGIALPLHSSAQRDTMLAASCCSVEKRCTGSAYCTACTDCSRCAHCGAGGSCGVCAGRRSGALPGSSYGGGSGAHGATDTYRSSGFADDPGSGNHGRTLAVTANELNVREGPGTAYPIVYQLTSGEEILFLAERAGWMKVRVIGPDITGYVSAKYVRFLE
jgi:uncharacterized protein YgiM (DUF1202 family)